MRRATDARLLAVIGFQKAGTTQLRGQLANACVARTNANEGCPALLVPHAPFGANARFANCTPEDASLYACATPAASTWPTASSASAKDSCGQAQFYAASLVVVAEAAHDRAYAAYPCRLVGGAANVKLTCSRTFRASSRATLSAFKHCAAHHSLRSSSRWCYWPTPGLLRFRNAPSERSVSSRRCTTSFERRRDLLAYLVAVLALGLLGRATTMAAPAADAVRRAADLTRRRRIRKFLARETAALRFSAGASESGAR